MYLYYLIKKGKRLKKMRNSFIILLQKVHTANKINKFPVLQRRNKNVRNKLKASIVGMIYCFYNTTYNVKYNTKKNAEFVYRFYYK